MSLQIQDCSFNKSAIVINNITSIYQIDPPRDDNTYLDSIHVTGSLNAAIKDGSTLILTIKLGLIALINNKNMDLIESLSNYDIDPSNAGNFDFVFPIQNHTPPGNYSFDLNAQAPDGSAIFHLQGSLSIPSTT
jgi:hypothetical protein